MKGVGVLSVSLVAVLAVLALGVGGAVGATVATHRRAAVGHSGGRRHHRHAHASAKKAPVPHNAFFDEMQGAPRPPPPPRAKGYTPSESDPTLSFPELDYSAVHAEPLTPLSVPNAMPTARNFRSTTLPMPLPDPLAPTADTIPHAAPSPPPSATRLMPRFRALREGLDTRDAITSPDGGALSPLRGDAAEQPHFSHGPSHRSLSESSRANAPYRQVIPIEVDPEALEAAETGSDADLMRFASVRGKEMSSGSASHKHKHKRGEEDITTPMALTESGPIAPYGPAARAMRFRNRPRHIFAKRVTIPLPIPGSAAAAAATATAGHDDEYGPFDHKKKHTAPSHNPNLAAEPQDAFGADVDPLAFLQTEQRITSRWGGEAIPSFVAEGDHVFQRVDARRMHDRHARNPHFHHRYRSEQETRDAVEADEMELMREEHHMPRGGAEMDQFGHRLPRGRSPASLLEETSDAGVTPLSDLSLPEPGAPRPHAQFASPPVDVDRFDPFSNTYGSARKVHGVPSAPARPAPPPMSAAPHRPNKSGILLPNTFLATHASVQTQRPKKNKKQSNKPAPKPTKPARKSKAPKKNGGKKKAPHVSDADLKQQIIDAHDTLQVHDEHEIKYPMDYPSPSSKPAASPKPKAKGKTKTTTKPRPAPAPAKGKGKGKGNGKGKGKTGPRPTAAPKKKATKKAKAPRVSDEDLKQQIIAAHDTLQFHDEHEIKYPMDYPAPKPKPTKPAPPKPAATPKPAPAAAPAAPTKVTAPIEVSLLQRLENEAGLRSVAAGSVSAATDLAALRRLEAAVHAAEERAELQARVEELQAQVNGLQQLRAQQHQ